MLCICLSPENIHQVNDFQFVFCVRHSVTPTFCINEELSCKSLQLSATSLCLGRTSNSNLQAPRAKRLPQIIKRKYNLWKTFGSSPSQLVFFRQCRSPHSRMPHKFSKFCGQSGYIVLHPFSSTVEGRIPNYERRDVYELCSSTN